MKRVLIRDDDISYFTPPEVLERLYHRFVDRSIPVNLSVIPRVSCSAPLPFETSNPYFDGSLNHEPFIPSQFRGQSRCFDIDENPELIKYIQRNPFMKVIQHGLTHDEPDLAFLLGNDPDKFRDALRQGKSILKRAFGEQPAFFTPPWGLLSPNAMEVLRGEFSGLCVLLSRRRRFLPGFDWCRYLSRVLRHKAVFCWQGLFVLTYPLELSRSRIPFPSDFLPRVMSALNRWDVLVIAHHHWEYLNDRSGWDEIRLAGWDALVNYLLDRTELRFETLASLAATARSGERRK